MSTFKCTYCTFDLEEGMTFCDFCGLDQLGHEDPGLVQEALIPIDLNELQGIESMGLPALLAWVYKACMSRGVDGLDTEQLRQELVKLLTAMIKKSGDVAGHCFEEALERRIVRPQISPDESAELVRSGQSLKDDDVINDGDTVTVRVDVPPPSSPPQSPLPLGKCVDGHDMPATSTFCVICGKPRQTTCVLSPPPPPPLASTCVDGHDMPVTSKFCMICGKPPQTTCALSPPPPPPLASTCVDGHDMPATSKFCTLCGKPPQTTCALSPPPPPLASTCVDGHGMPSTARFCTTCGKPPRGEPLQKTCEDGHDMPSTARFCTVCGKPPSPTP